MATTSATPRIISIGELLWDILPAGPRLGGTTTNFAAFSSRLGNRAALVSSLGDDDYGRAARPLLEKANLDLSLLQQTDHPTGTVEVTFSADRQPVYTIHTEVAWDYIRLTGDVVEAAHGADAVCFGTLGQRHEVSRSTIRGFVEATPPRCVRVCDINLRMPFCTPETLAWSLSHATIIKCSDEELPQVFALLGKQAPAAPREAAQILLQCFPACLLVALSLGAHGCLAATRQATVTHPGFPIKVVDTVGAGDAFTAGLTHAYLRGASLPQMAEAGNLCGSYVASLPEATPQLSPAFLEHMKRVLSENHES
jgi:fructokinase